MKKFLQKIGLFLLLMLMFFIAGVVLPATPRASTSMLFSEIEKDSLLKNVASPRIILIGGSSMSMSIDSQRIKDSLGLNPVNTGVHASTGLIYMLDNTIGYIRKGDLIVIIPEYDQLYGNFAFGGQELLRTILDVKHKNVLALRIQQYKNMVPFLPRYVISKFKPSEYGNSNDNMLYLRHAYNHYGDCTGRLEHQPPNSLVFGPLTESYNADIINELKAFERKANEKGAKVILSFPAFQQESFNNITACAKQVELAYRNSGFMVIGNPEEYSFSNNLMYDTPYHLTKEGMAIRTLMLIRELIDEAHIKRRQR